MTLGGRFGGIVEYTTSSIPSPRIDLVLSLVLHILERLLVSRKLV